MKVNVLTPAGDIVLFRQLPAKLLEGNGAYKHTLVLTTGGVSVIVRMHVLVKSKDELITNKIWKMQILPWRVDNEVMFTLTPARKGIPANVSEIKLKELQAKDRVVTLELCEIVRKEKPVFQRRHVRAAIEASIGPM